MKATEPHFRHRHFIDKQERNNVSNESSTTDLPLLHHHDHSCTSPSNNKEEIVIDNTRNSRGSFSLFSFKIYDVSNEITQQRMLFTTPIMTLIIVSSLDNADKQLLASSFGILEQTLHLDVKMLGYFSMYTNLSYALSLPLWGYLVHRYGIDKVHNLLAVACLLWGLTTIGIAQSGSSIMCQAIFRSLNGVALGSILPLSQTLLIEMVQPHMKGRAFGLMTVFEKLAGTIASASVVYFDAWQNFYFVLGIFSVIMSLVCKQQLSPKHRSQYELISTAKHVSQQQKRLTLCEIIFRILKNPAFLCLVAQGVFGGTPWEMMSFTILLMQWRGFTKQQIVSIQFMSGIASTIGGWLGGLLGDIFAPRHYAGRIWVAIVSVSGGIPLYGLYLFATNYHTSIICICLFHVWAVWTPAAALRPICADLAHDANERAQIVSLWIVLEKVSGAIFGAPLVGYITSNMIQTENNSIENNNKDRANTLAMNMFLLSSLFWGICAVLWVTMARVYQLQKQQQQQQGEKVTSKIRPTEIKS